MTKDDLQTTTRRQNRTKTHFKQALIDLIKEIGYHSITVKDLVEYANYNRSTFYVHFQDKEHLAKELLESMLNGLEQSVGQPYTYGQRVNTSQLTKPAFNIVHFIYENRNFFELVKYENTLPGLHTQFPLTITKIYKEQFIFKTINNTPVNMNYFKLYTSYGFYGLVMDWITSNFSRSEEDFINDIIDLTKTHISSYEYIGK